MYHSVAQQLSHPDLYYILIYILTAHYEFFFVRHRLNRAEPSQEEGGGQNSVGVQGPPRKLVGCRGNARGGEGGVWGALAAKN